MRVGNFLFLLLIIFFSYSCAPQCNQWKLAVIKADCPSAIYTKVYLSPFNTFNGLEAVFSSSNGHFNLYLNAFTLFFPFYGCDEEHSEVIITIEEEKFSLIAERLQGGQSLKMPNEAIPLIAKALLEKKSAEITVGRFHTILIYENFEKTFRSLRECAVII